MIVLASQSASRRAMLKDAGVRFEVVPPHLDERAVEQRLGGVSAERLALALAEAKALAIEGQERLVLGSDSLVVVEGQRFDKPANRDEAAEHLRFFSGRMMELHSGAALARSGALVWCGTAMAALKVRELSEAFIGSYLAAEWPAVSGCVGVFRIEGPGAQLFEAIEGDMFTVLGMPLLQVLAALRKLGELPA